MQLLTDRLRRSRRFGFVAMAIVTEAEAAITRLNGNDLEGRRLVVDLARPPGAKGGGIRRDNRWPADRGPGRRL